MGGMAARSSDGTGPGYRSTSTVTTVEGDAQSGSLRWIPWCAVIVLVAITLVTHLGSLGYGSLPHEEAWRATWTYDLTLERARRFPPLWGCTYWLLQHTVGRSEMVLRLPSALAGLACVGLLYRFTVRRIGFWPAVLVAAVAAAHPALIFHSRTMKVFGIDALMTTVLIGVGLSAFRNPTSLRLYAFLAAGVAGLAFTFASVFVTAAWIPLIAWACVRHRDSTNRPLPHFAVVSFVLIVAGSLAYVWAAGSTHMAMLREYQASVLHSWPEDYSLSGLTAWLAENGRKGTLHVLGVADVWPPLCNYIGTLEVLAIAASAGVLWQRCKPICVLAMLLLVETVVAGALRLWPLGRADAETFLVPVAALAIGCGIWEFARRFGRSAPTVLLIALCVVVPTARAVKATVIAPRPREHVRPVLAYVDEKRAPDDALFIYYGARDAFDFYWSDPNTATLVQPSDDRGQIRLFANRFDGWIARNPRVWLVFSHPWADERKAYIEYIERRYAVTDRFSTGSGWAYLVQRSARIPSTGSESASR